MSMRIILIVFALLLPAVAFAAGSENGSFGMLSLLPPIIAITLALILRQVIPSLLIGVILGATIYCGGNPLLGVLRTLDNYMLDALADHDHAAIVLFSMTLGGMVGIVSACGGSAGIVNMISRFAKSAKSGAIAAWIMGMIIFFDDYASTLIVGNTMRPYTDRLKISREKLSYIVDSTSAPIASIALISTWIGFEMGLIADAFTKLNIDKNVYLTFVESIPYRFYCLTALLLVPMIALTGRDLGPMLTAERRARSTGKVLRDGAKPLSEDIALTEQGIISSSWNALVPIAVVILATAFGLYWSGKSAAGPDAPLYNIIGSANSFSALMWAAFAGAVSAIFLAVFNSSLKFDKVLDAFLSGAKSMVLAMIILILAWALGKTCDDLGTAVYVSGLVKGAIPLWMLPALTFIIAAFISFSTGTSWGTMAILVPIIIPVTYNLAVPDKLSGLDAVVYIENHWHVMLSSIGSVLAGSVFGDHCSPISDTTIMSSMTSGADHIDHVRTQMPYAILAALAATLLGDLPSGFGFNPFISLTLALTAMYLVLKIFGGKSQPFNLNS